jgi:hypothetical protein
VNDSIKFGKDGVAWKMNKVLFGYVRVCVCVYVCVWQTAGNWQNIRAKYLSKKFYFQMKRDKYFHG